MTSGNTDLVVRRAVLADLDAIKIIADQNKHELGFIVRRALERSIEGNEMLVAVDDSDRLSGFLQYHHRRDGYITLYNIAVQFGNRNTGLGTKLIKALVQEARSIPGNIEAITLKCPSELPANDFYRSRGFVQVAVEPGKHRGLNIWKFSL